MTCPHIPAWVHLCLEKTEDMVLWLLDGAWPVTQSSTRTDMCRDFAFKCLSFQRMCQTVVHKSIEKPGLTGSGTGRVVKESL